MSNKVTEPNWRSVWWATSSITAPWPSMVIPWWKTAMVTMCMPGLLVPSCYPAMWWHTIPNRAALLSYRCFHRWKRDWSIRTPSLKESSCAAVVTVCCHLKDLTSIISVDWLFSSIFLTSSSPCLNLTLSMMTWSTRTITAVLPSMGVLWAAQEV